VADDTNNLVLEHLRGIRAVVDHNGERLDRVETRLATIEQVVGHLFAQGATDREAMHSLEHRVSRIEHRLERRDAD
jgi:uncharacterized coiled-coil protein SlyX